MKIILQWLIVAGAVMITPYVLDGISIANFYTALVVALVWGLISFFVKPILNILTLPINLLTLGLFSFVLNGLLFWFISSFIKGFYVDGFISAILGSLFVSITSFVLGKLLIKS